MSSLQPSEKSKLERLLGMSSGYVLHFTDRTFGDFFHEHIGVEIHSKRYMSNGTSKANKLRTFWSIESDSVVGKLLLALIDTSESNNTSAIETLISESRSIANRLLAGGPSLDSLKEEAKAFNAVHLTKQIRRMESSVESDPSLAIGTAKELIETCCKTILSERGKILEGTPDVSTLTKETLKALKLVPEGIPEAGRGSDVIKRVLSSLGQISNGLTELRNLYGTGHGKHGKAPGLTPRHAKLAVGAAATLATFLFETHKEVEK